MSESESPSTTSRSRVRRRERRDIQGLRAFAVLSVIADHVAGWPHGGFVGVDVFFVISGFLITGLMLREADRSGRVSLTGFYRRRIKRLMPAALLVLAVTVVAAAFLLPRTRAISVVWDAVFAAGFVVNWRLAAVGTDYFSAGQPPSPLQHYWSLSVEEQFYVVWPLVIIAVLAVLTLLNRRRGRTGDPGPARDLALGTLILGIFAVSLAWAWHESVSNPTFAYFSTLARAWELAAGAALAVALHRTTRRIPAALAPLLSWIGVIGICVSWFVVSETSNFPAPGALLPVLATVLVLAAGADQPESFDRRTPLLTNRACTYVGDISYSLYLWHFPVAILLLALLPAESARYLFVALVLIAVLSVASYHLVEDPVRRSAWLTPRMQWGTAARAAVAFAAVVALGAVALTAVQLNRDVAQQDLADVGDADCVGVDYLLNDCSPDDLTGVAVPAADTLADDTGGAYDCWRLEGGDFPTCATDATDAAGEGDDVYRVAVVGDSHAAMLLPALRPVAEERDWALDTYLGYGCQWRTDPADCGEVMDEIQQHLLDGGYDLIITSGARWAVPDDPVGSAAQGYADRWAPVVATGVPVIAIADSPTGSEDAVACVSRVGFDPRTDDCATSADAALDPVDPLPAAVEQTPGTALVEVEDLYCVAEQCPGSIGGVSVYRDAVGHVTATYMETLTPVLTERIDAALASLQG